MRGFTTIRLGLALVGLAVAMLAAATPALASRTQVSIFQDDRLLTNYGERDQGLALDRLAYLGVDEIHTVVNWRRFAPHPGSKKKPRGFDATNSRSYGATK